MRLLSSVVFVLACTAATPRNLSGYPPGNPATYRERLAGVWLSVKRGEGGNARLTFKLKIVSDVAFGDTLRSRAGSVAGATSCARGAGAR